MLPCFGSPLKNEAAQIPLLFCYLFHPHVTTVASKRSRSFCQKCRWQVSTKQACTLCIRFCMKWRDMVHTDQAKIAAVTGGTSHATIQVLQVHHFDGYQKCATKSSSFIQIHMQHECSKSAQERRQELYKTLKANKYKLQLSLKDTTQVLLQPAVYSENRKGARTVPWGAPAFIQKTWQYSNQPSTLKSVSKVIKDPWNDTLTDDGNFQSDRTERVTTRAVPPDSQLYLRMQSSM